MTEAEQALIAWRACRVMRNIDYPVESREALALLGRLGGLSEYPALRLFCRRQLETEVLAGGGFA